ncbi:MAG: helix-turn-helix domain-containing protein [Rubricoccaceae bacterium]
MNELRATFPPWNVYNAQCPTRHVLDLISGRWANLVIGALANEVLRFGELRRRADGVSNKSLSKTLKDLERSGIISRTVFAEVPPRTEYKLTDLGRSLTEPLAALRAWSESNIEHILAARADYVESLADA